jgi:hypothetical protein
MMQGASPRERRLGFLAVVGAAVLLGSGCARTGVPTSQTPPTATTGTQTVEASTSPDESELSMLPGDPVPLPNGWAPSDVVVLSVDSSRDGIEGRDFDIVVSNTPTLTITPTPATPPIPNHHDANPPKQHDARQ